MVLIMQNKHLLNLVFVLIAIIFTAMFLYASYSIYFSDLTNAFEVILITFILIIYSNLLAIAYRYTRIWIK